jgi:tRNA A-37 threonylcarbamoyl transferase component Bud32
VSGADTSTRLKHDHFGSISRVADARGERIRRDTRDASLGLRWFARLAARREARALRALAGVAGIPPLIHFDGRVLERGFLAGSPMHDAKPRDPIYYREAHRLLRALHERGVAHNDLAKEANWMVLDDGAPGLLDFQLAAVSSRRGSWFRLQAREDLRHMLKHKRTYCPERLTPTERRVLARRSWLARAWMASGKKLYIFVARRILNWEDNEARGRRGL